MKQRELARLHVLNNVHEYQIPIGQAAEVLGVSERHARRLLNAYRKEGAAALAHGNRGRQPHNAVLDSEAAAVVQLASTVYAGTNHTHLTELLREREGIDLSRPTVRRILVKAGLGSPRSRRSQQHRVRRQRMPQEGMLVQVDGSHHRWLGKDGPRFALLLTVDDATGTVPAAMFCREEDTPSYFLLMNELIQQRGIPLPSRGRCPVRLRPGEGGDRRSGAAVHYFVLDLPHSDACFVKAYPAETTEAFCDGHVSALSFLGGVPRSIVYDNTMLAVAKILGDGRRQRTRVFSELVACRTARHSSQTACGLWSLMASCVPSTQPPGRPSGRLKRTMPYLYPESRMGWCPSPTPLGSP